MSAKGARTGVVHVGRLARRAKIIRRQTNTCTVVGCVLPFRTPNPESWRGHSDAARGSSAHCSASPSSSVEGTAAGFPLVAATSWICYHARECLN